MNQEHRDNIPDAFPCDRCPKVCNTIGGLARHSKIKHPPITPPTELTFRTHIFHSTLNGGPPFLPSFFSFLYSFRTTARPCAEDGAFLQAPPDSTSPLTAPSQDGQHAHDWSPFEDHLAFDWASYHYMKLQLSAASIVEGLNLWSATAIKHGSSAGAPWRTANEMYATIDAIRTGSLPFKSFKFRYTGPKPPTPPHWMEQTYELNTRDILSVVREQLATADFSGQFDYVPYKEFNSKGERLWSNLMSVQWAFMQAVCLFLL